MCKRQTIWRVAFIVLLCSYFYFPTIAWAGIIIAGEERLSPTGKSTLNWLLANLPASLYPHLQVITVEGAAIPANLTGETCNVPPYPGPCRINILSSPQVEQAIEDPFPSDAPIHQYTSVFYQVAAHELGHSVSAWAYWERGGDWWQKRLVAEAGCEPINYLRSMISRCYFRDNPQEFVASMINQWAACSECVFRLAVARWDRGIPHPLNQAIYLSWLFGSVPSGSSDLAGTILGYHYSGGPDLLLLTASPWRCGADVVIVGMSWSLVVELNDVCGVVNVKQRNGI